MKKIACILCFTVFNTARADVYIHKGIYPNGIECSTVIGSSMAYSSSSTTCTTAKERARNEEALLQQKEKDFNRYLENTKEMGIAPRCSEYGYQKALVERNVLTHHNMVHTDTVNNEALGIQSVKVVKLGDTLAKIASSNGITLQRLIELNPGIEYNPLTIGSQVRLRNDASVNLKPFSARATFFELQCQQKIIELKKLPEDYQQLIQVKAGHVAP